MKWQYQVTERPTRETNDDKPVRELWQDHLNEHAQEGWEFVAVDSTHFFWKKPAPSNGFSPA